MLFDEEDYEEREGKIIQRFSELEVAPHKKEKLLRETLEHYTGQETPDLQEWEFCQEVEKEVEGWEGAEDNIFVSCICSQSILNCHFIKHTKSGYTFRIGRNCFENLYTKAALDNIDFFKPNCLNCEKKKVPNKRTRAGKLGFCCDKCYYIYQKKVPCDECGKRFWRNQPNHLLCKKCWCASFNHYRKPSNLRVPTIC